MCFIIVAQYVWLRKIAKLRFSSFALPHKKLISLVTVTLLKVRVIEAAIIKNITKYPCSDKFIQEYRKVTAYPVISNMDNTVFTLGVNFFPLIIWQTSKQILPNAIPIPTLNVPLYIIPHHNSMPLMLSVVSDIHPAQKRTNTGESTCTNKSYFALITGYKISREINIDDKYHAGTFNFKL